MFKKKKKPVLKEDRIGFEAYASFLIDSFKNAADSKKRVFYTCLVEPFYFIVVCTKKEHVKAIRELKRKLVKRQITFLDFINETNNIIELKFIFDGSDPNDNGTFVYFMKLYEETGIHAFYCYENDITLQQFFKLDLEQPKKNIFIIRFLQKLVFSIKTWLAVLESKLLFKSEKKGINSLGEMAFDFICYGLLFFLLSSGVFGMFIKNFTVIIIGLIIGFVLYASMVISSKKSIVAELSACSISGITFIILMTLKKPIGILQAFVCIVPTLVILAIDIFISVRKGKEIK